MSGEVTPLGEIRRVSSVYARRRGDDFFFAVFLVAFLAEPRAVERVVFLPARTVFLPPRADFTLFAAVFLREAVFLRPPPVAASARGLILRSAMAVSLASVAFSSLRLSPRSFASWRWPSSVAQAMSAP